MNIGKEGEAFVAEPLPEEQPQTIESPAEREEELVPVAVESDPEALSVS